MISLELLQHLRECVQERRIGEGIALLDKEREQFEQIHPGEWHAGLAVGCLAQWLDVGFQDAGALAKALKKFDTGARQTLSLTDMSICGWRRRWPRCAKRS